MSRDRATSVNPDSPARPGLALTRLLEPLHGGSSLPWRVLASDGGEYVVKFVGAGGHGEALAAELIVSRLATWWNLPVPACRLIDLAPSLPKAGTDEFWDVLDASIGTNLAIDFIPEATTLPAEELEASRALLANLEFIDRLFRNADRSNLSDNVLTDGSKSWIIDHGSCRFLHHLGGPPNFDLPPNHFLAASDPPGAIPPNPAASTDPSRETIAELIADLPEAWLTNTPHAKADLPALLAAHIAAYRKKFAAT